MSRIEPIKKMLAAEPDDVFLNFSLAMEYVKADRPDDALEQFRQVSRIDPDYIPAYFQQGRMMIALERHDEARTVLAQGVAVAERIGDTHAVAEMNETLAALG